MPSLKASAIGKFSNDPRLAEQPLRQHGELRPGFDELVGTA